MKHIFHTVATARFFKPGIALVIAAALIVSALAPGIAAKRAGAPSGAVLLVVPGSKSDPASHQSADLFFSLGTKLDPKINWQTRYAGGKAKQQTRWANLGIEGGVNVIVLDQVNPTVGAKIALEAHANGIKVIAYDQMIKVQTLDFYDGFDPVAGGRLEGQFVRNHAASGSQLEFVNGAKADYTSAALQNGYCAKVLCPLIKQGKFTQAGSCYVQSTTAAESCAYKAATHSHRLGGVAVGPNNLVTGATTGLTKAHASHVAVAGGSCPLDALRSILAGTIGMCVYVPVTAEAKAAVDETYAIIAGHPPALEYTHKLSNSYGPVISALATPVAVTLKTMAQTVIKDGYVGKKALCKGLQSACKRAGI